MKRNSHILGGIGEELSWKYGISKVSLKTGKVSVKMQNIHELLNF